MAIAFVAYATYRVFSPRWRKPKTAESRAQPKPVSLALERERAERAATEIPEHLRPLLEQQQEAVTPAKPGETGPETNSLRKQVNGVEPMTAFLRNLLHDRRKACISLGVLLFVLAGLFPLWVERVHLAELGDYERNAGYSFITSGVAPRTVNLEVGVLRSILRRHRMWEAIAPAVDFLKEAPSPGRALSAEEETRLLETSSKSRCRSLYPVVMLALNTGMRASEIRGLRWEQVDLLAHTLTVGQSTAAGTGRLIPLNARAVAVLTHWRGLFGGVQP